MKLNKSVKILIGNRIVLPRALHRRRYGGIIVMHDTPICPLWNYEESAHYLGLSVTKLSGLVSARQVPHIRMGRLVRFRKQDLDGYLDRLAEESVHAHTDYTDHGQQSSIPDTDNGRHRIAPGIRPIKP